MIDAELDARKVERLCNLLTERTIVAPHLNINGSSLNSLAEEIAKPLSMAYGLKAALGEMAPHGRDYQTVKPEVYQAALRQHERRMIAVNLLVAELDAELQMLYEQADEREKMKGRREG